MSKNSYEKDEVWGTVALIVCIGLLLLFIRTEWAQMSKINTLMESNYQLTQSQEIIENRLNNFDFVSKDTYEREKETLENRIDGVYDSASGAHDRLYELNLKLSDRIPNWNKR